MFLSVLFAYSVFVLTSVGTKYYTQFTARALEYYVYIWNFGDFIEEIMGCIVSNFLSVLFYIVFVTITLIFYIANRTTFLTKWMSIPCQKTVSVNKYTFRALTVNCKRGHKILLVLNDR